MQYRNSFSMYAMTCGAWIPAGDSNASALLVSKTVFILK
jgi:hypothetical protein